MPFSTNRQGKAVIKNMSQCASNDVQIFLYTGKCFEQTTSVNILIKN